ncbi:MAG: hypothetical protein SFW67_37240 [Myxococcaceae bacterium]|nr:hypothetical protein [Myxococcaceae bacterium]
MRASVVVAGLLAMAGCERGQLVVPEQAFLLDGAVTTAARPTAEPAPALPNASVDAGLARKAHVVTTFDAASLPDPAMGPPCEPGDDTPRTMAARTNRGFNDQYRTALEAGRLADGTSLTLSFCGDLRPLLALGFTLFSADLRRGQASGVVQFHAAERLVQHPGVRRLEVGEESQVDPFCCDF